MLGKERCKILKEIRQKIADENGIEFITSQCKHKGDCLGTCPKCESEVAYLEQELKKRMALGKRIAVVGVAASIALTGMGCSKPIGGDELEGDVPAVEENIQGDLQPEEEVELGGDIPLPDEGLEPAFPDVDIPGEIADFVIPEKPEDLEGYTADEISDALAGMNLEDITSVWGQPDMTQKSEGRGIIAYFTDLRDIVVQYDVETNTVINATTIENE